MAGKQSLLNSQPREAKSGNDESHLEDAANGNSMSPDDAFDLLQEIEKAYEKAQMPTEDSYDNRVVIRHTNQVVSDNQGKAMKRQDIESDQDYDRIPNVLDATTGDLAMPLPMVALTRDQIAIHRVQNPGAVYVRAPGMHLIDEDQASSVAEDEHEVMDELHHPITLDATLVDETPIVGPNSDVRPAIVTEATPIDTNLLKRQREREADMEIQRRSKLRRFIIVSVLALMIVIAGVSVGIYLSLKPTNENNNSQNINATPKTDAYSFEQITHHAVIFDAQMNCQEITSDEVPNKFMKLQCFNPNGISGEAAITFEMASDNVNCTQVLPNSLECNATFNRSTDNRFYTIFTCGTLVTNTSMNISQTPAHLQTFPLTGVACVKKAVLAATMARFCAPRIHDSLYQWSFEPVINSSSCSNVEYEKLGNWPFCRSYDSCNHSICSENLSLPEIIEYDNKLETKCQRPPKSPDKTQWLQQLTEILKSW